MIKNSGIGEHVHIKHTFAVHDDRLTLLYTQQSQRRIRRLILSLPTLGNEHKRI